MLEMGLPLNSNLVGHTIDIKQNNRWRSVKVLSFRDSDGKHRVSLASKIKVNKDLNMLLKVGHLRINAGNTAPHVLTHVRASQSRLKPRVRCPPRDG